MAIGGGGGTGFSGRFGYIVPEDLNKLLALVGGVGFLGGTCGAAGLEGFCSSVDFSSFSSGFKEKYFFSAAIISGFGAGALAGGGGFFGFGKSLSSSFIWTAKLSGNTHSLPLSSPFHQPASPVSLLIKWIISPSLKVSSSSLLPS